MTLRELCWAVEGRLKRDWSQTSALIAAAYNNHPYNTRLWKPDDFNPMVDRNRNPPRRRVLSLLSLAKMLKVPGVPDRLQGKGNKQQVTGKKSGAGNADRNP